MQYFGKRIDHWRPGRFGSTPSAHPADAGYTTILFDNFENRPSPGYVEKAIRVNKIRKSTSFH